MKLSLAWIFDHIVGDWHDLAINEFIQKFNDTIAEVDFFTKVTFDLDSYALGRVTRVNENVSLFVPEWNKECILPTRKDAYVGSYYLIRKDKKNYHFATMADFASEKEGLLPPLWVPDVHMKGEWKSFCQCEDYVLLIDNKSLTHRPDLWGHRGMAREVAAMLGLELKPEEQFLIQCVVKNYEKSTPVTKDNPISLAIEAPEMCNRLAGFYIKEVTSKPSLIHVAQRLSQIDARPIESLIDATNYVMYDLGQPMHAFDALDLKGNVLIARPARPGEKLALLDGETIHLDHSDCVIADAERPLSLAGVMGGERSAVKPITTRILLESAHFNPTVIRRSSLRHKKRTEASARFEKGLDPNQNTLALMRYLFLLDAWGVNYQASREIVSIGQPATEKKIVLSIDFISKKIGTPVGLEVIKKTLSKLGFGLQEDKNNFIVTVPTYRLRDVSIKEDIVEEIARFIGYGSITHKLPTRLMRPQNHWRVEQTRFIKRHCAFAYGMHELSNYPLYDEEFLRALSWQPGDAARVSNPVSENWQRLVTSLIPHLLKAVKINETGTPLRFFEWGRIWNSVNNHIDEKHSLALMWYEPDKEIDFYDIKASLTSLFDLIEVSVKWEKPDVLKPWYHPYQTALLTCDNLPIGYAGKISPFFLNSIAKGDAFIVELDAQFLAGFKKADYQMIALSKYPQTHLDISMFIPDAISVDALEMAVASADARIRDVFLIDYRQKTDAQGLRSVTIRYIIIDDFKTLTKQEIDTIAQDVIQAVQLLGVTVR